MIEPNENTSEQHANLSPADAAALDRLMQSGLADAHGEREQRLLDLLGLLDTPVSGESQRGTRLDLIQVHASRAARSEAHGQADDQHLSPADTAALDHWMQSGYSPAPEPLRERVGRLEALASVTTTGQPASPEARTRLIERTLAAVQAAEQEQAGRMRFEDHAEASGSRFRLADLVSVAAMLLIAVSIGLPAFQGVSRHQEQVACLTNMQSAARAFGTYAGANADMLPMTTAGFGGSWMEVGNPSRSNSANLYTLPREGYARLDDFACPSNPLALRGTPREGALDWGSMDELSYSYRIMGQNGLRMTVAVPSVSGVVVTADRSPVTLRAARGEIIFPEANTPNHAGRGQHVLFLDGSTVWATSPVIMGDNIWLPRQVEEIIHQVRSRMGVIQGDEMPASETDAFVGP